MLTKRVPPAAMKLPASPSAIFVKIGDWFEASATGWGVLALPAIVLLVLGVGLLRLLLEG